MRFTGGCVNAWCDWGRPATALSRLNDPNSVERRTWKLYNELYNRNIEQTK